MAEAPSQSPPPLSFSGTDTNAPSPPPQEYWCYHCDKRVSVETVANHPDVICGDCKNGFAESITPSSRPSDDQDDDPYGSPFLQVLRLFAQTARDDDAPPLPQNPTPEEDFLRIELDGWDNDEDDDDDEAHSVEFHNAGGVENEEDDDVRSYRDEDEENRLDRGERDEAEEVRRRRQDVLRLRISDLARHSGRARILDWAEILMGLDNSIELRFDTPDRYIGNPEDYIDGTARYEALLQTLAESDSSGRRGAPPASKTVISELPAVDEASSVCAICKDVVNVDEMSKKLPCGHGYHGDCIVPWLSTRNSCPVCRFELPTDDAEYEEERKNSKKFAVNVSSGGASGSGGGDRSVSR